LKLTYIICLIKMFIAIAVMAAAFACWGCGEDEVATSSGTQTDRFATITDERDGSKPHIDPPNRPPPKQPLVRGIKVGSGPVAHRGDEVSVYYIGVNYRTGKRMYQTWPPPKSPYTLRLGFGGSGDAWEKGIEGMRVGGRRELIVPSRLLFRTGTIDYVVDLVRVERAS